MVWEIVVAVIIAGASYVQAKKAQKKAKEATEGVEANIESNSKEIPVVYGERRVGGVRVYIDTSRDVKHKYLYMVLAMAEGEVESITDIKIDDIPITDSRFRIGGIDNNPNIWYQVFTGTDTQTVSTLIREGVSYDNREDVWVDPYYSQHEHDVGIPEITYPWTVNHRLQGIAYLALKFKWDENAYQGIPDVTAVVKGKKVYDPRTQTTAWSDNPALCILDYLTNEKYGKGLSLNELDLDAFGQAATDCEDFTVTPFTGSTATHQLFTMDAVIDTKNKIIENLNDMLIGCRGFLPFTQGKYRLIIDQPKNSIFTFTQDHIIDGISIKGSRKEDRFNQVKVNFFNKGQEYKEDQAIYPETNSTLYQQYLAEDQGEPLVEELDIFSFDNVYSAREMARLVLERSRKNLGIAFNATSEALVLDIGDVFAITHPTPAWTNKLFQVQELSFNYDGTVSVSAVEYDADLYTYDEPDEEQPYVGSRLPDTSEVDPVTNLAASSSSYVDADGKTIGYIDISWNAPSDELVDRYDIKLAYDGKDEVINTASTQYRYKPTKDNTNYTISVRAINGINIRSAWVSLQPLLSAKDTTAPSQPTSITATGGIKHITLDWTNPTEDDFDTVEIYAHTTGITDLTTVADTATLIATVRVDNFQHDIGANEATRHYFLRSVDRTGNKSAFTDGVSGTTVKVAGGDISVTNLGDISTDLGTPTSGTIDGNNLTVQNLSASSINTGTLDANNVTISNLTIGYDSVTDTPTIPSNVSDLTNDSGFITSVAWGDITGTAPNVSTFNNDSQFITSSDVPSNPQWFGLTGRSDTTAPSDTDFNTAFSRDPVKGDVLLVTDTSNATANYQYDGSTWGAISALIRGDLVVSDSITATQINTDTVLTEALLANTADITGDLTVTSGKITVQDTDTVINLDPDAQYPFRISQGTEDVVRLGSSTLDPFIKGAFIRGMPVQSINEADLTTFVRNVVGVTSEEKTETETLTHLPTGGNLVYLEADNITTGLTTVLTLESVAGTQSWVYEYADESDWDSGDSAFFNYTLQGYNGTAWEDISGWVNRPVFASGYRISGALVGWSISETYSRTIENNTYTHFRMVVGNMSGEFGGGLHPTSTGINCDFKLTSVTGSQVNSDNYANSFSINDTSGVLTIGRTGSLGDLTADISTYVGNQVSALVDSAPTTLDTLNELASALGDDPNFATTVSTSLGNKANKAGDTFTGTIIQSYDSTVWSHSEATHRPLSKKIYSETGIANATTGANITDVYGESDLSAIDNDATFTYADAWDAVESHGGRLPTLAEVMDGVGQGSGQGYDDKYIWTCTPAGAHHVWVVKGNYGAYPDKKIVDINDSLEVYRTRCFFDVSRDGRQVHYSHDGKLYIQNNEVTSTKISNWNTAYSWGDHSTQNYAVTTGDTFTGGLILNGSSNALTFGENPQGVSYTPQEGGERTQRYFLRFNYTNNDSFPYLCNRTPNGRVGLYSGGTNEGLDVERIRILGGDGTKQVQFHNSEIAIGSNTVIDSARNLTNIGTISSTGNVTISKESPTLILSDNNSLAGSYPSIEFKTTNAKDVRIYHTEFDSELPFSGYGLVIDAASSNTQFPTTGEMGLAVIGQIYTGDNSLGSTNRVWHEGDFTSTQVGNWDTAYGWGNHADAGYLTSIGAIAGIQDGVETTAYGEIQYRITGNNDVQQQNSIYAYGNKDVSWDWKFKNLSDETPVNRDLMTLTMVNSTTANLNVTGTITASGYNNSDWDSAYTYSQVGHLPLSGGTVTGNLQVDGYIRVDRNNDEKALIFEDSGGADTIYHTVNDGQGNYNIMLGVNGSGNSTKGGDGQAKVLFSGHGQDGSVSINAGQASTNTGDAVNYNIGLLVTSIDQTIRVGNPNDDVGIQTNEGSKFLDVNRNAFFNSVDVNGSTVIDSARNLTNIGTISSTGNATIDGNLTLSGYRTLTANQGTFSYVNGGKFTIDNDTIGKLTLGSITNEAGNDYVRESIIFSRDANQITYDTTTDQWTHAGGGSTDWSMITHDSQGMNFYSGGELASATSYTHAEFEAAYRAFQILTDQTVVFDNVPKVGTNEIWDKGDFSTTDVSNWNTAYGWGDHSTRNYAVTTGDTFTGTVVVPQILFDNKEKTDLSTTSGSIIFDLNDTDAPTSLGTYGSLHPLGLYVRDADDVISTIYHTGHFSGTHISNWNTAYGWGDHASAGYLPSTHDMTLTLSGDVSGSATFTNMGNATLSVTVADNSHNHDHSDGNFTVNGDATVTGGDLRIYNDASNYGRILFGESATDGNLIIEYDGTGSGATNYFNFYSDVIGWATKGSSLNIQPSTGNVAVGSNTYTEKFNVTGNIRADAYKIGTTTVIDSSRNLTNIGTISTSGSISVSGYNSVSAFSGSFTYLTGALTGNVTGDLTGNASTASKWQNARTITLGGDLTGSVSLDGSGDVTLSAQVVNDSHSHSNYITSNANDTATGRYVFSQTSTTIGSSDLGNATILIGSTSNGWGIDNNELLAKGGTKYFGTLDDNELTIRRNNSDYIRLLDGAVRFDKAIHMGNSTIVDASRNITNITSISSGSITSSGGLSFSDRETGVITFGSSGNNPSWSAPKIFRIDSSLCVSDYSGVKLGGYNGTSYGARLHVNGNGNVDILEGDLRIGTTTVIDSSRNLTNIGTISSGAITTSSNVIVANGSGLVSTLGAEVKTGAGGGTFHIRPAGGSHSAVVVQNYDATTNLLEVNSDGNTVVHKNLKVVGKTELIKPLFTDSISYLNNFSDEPKFEQANTATSGYYCANAGTCLVGVVEPKTKIYSKDPSTGTESFIGEYSPSDVNTLTAVAGKIYFTKGNKPFALIKSGNNRAFLPLSASGRYFGFYSNRYQPHDVKFYALDGSIEVDLYNDKGIDGTPTSTVTVKSGEIGGFIIADEGWCYFEVRGGVAVAYKTATGGGDADLLYPASRIRVQPDNTFGGSYRKIFSNTNATSSNTVYYDLDEPVIGAAIGDGAGGDTQTGRPVQMLCDNYIIPHNLDGIAFTAVYPNTDINVYYHNGTDWVKKDSYSLDGTLLSPAVTSSGNLDAGGTSYINSGNRTVWVSANQPIAVKVNDNDDDEYCPVGWLSAYKNVNVDLSNDDEFGSISVNGSITTTNKLSISNASFDSHFELIRAGSTTQSLSPSGADLLHIGGNFAPNTSLSQGLGRSDKIWSHVYSNSFQIGTTTVIDSGRNINGETITASGQVESIRFLANAKTSTAPSAEECKFDGYGVQGNRTTNPVYIHNQGDGGIRISGNATLGTANGLLVKDTATTCNGTFTASSNITAYSDITLKDNITSIDNALDKVNSIRGVTYDRIDQDNARHAGVIAQEVEEVLPEVVHTDDNGIKSVAYGNMVGLLIEAIKEQQAQINELKEELKNVNSN